MKKFVHKVQELGNKAAQIKAAIESVPPKVAEMREAVAATASQFQQLRSDVQSNVRALHADNEDKLIQTLREIDGDAATFREAGYDLYDVEMELGLPQRLIVELEKVEDVPYHRLRSLIAANESKRTTHAILSALLNAEELADRVELANLAYHKLMVYVGPLPTVRLCWCATNVKHASSPAAPAIPEPASGPTQPASSFPSSSIFGSGSFFEKRTSAPVPTASMTDAVAGAPAPLSAPTASTPALEKHEDPLARFKKMPDLSKRH